MNYKTERIFFYSLLFISFITVVCINISANATFDTGDGIQHYLIAHYSWKHPRLFLDMWGKPFFTLVSSPFMQFGMNGAIVFQALCAAGTSFFCYKIAQKINLDFAWSIPAYIFFSPIYFALINSGLTEIFFGFLFMFSVWLIFQNKFLWGAIAASFIPFVRPEAYVVLPLIALVLLIRKQFFSIPFLFFAFISYSVIGYFYYHDLFWVITQNYSITEVGYEGQKGEFLHFVKHYDEIWGTVYSALLILGICTSIYFIFSFLSKKSKTDFLPEILFLIFGSFFDCLLLHSLLYWMPDIFTNLGMLRYMTTLIPSASLISLMGINLIFFFLFKHYRYLKIMSVAIILWFIIQTPFQQSYYPFHLNSEQVVIKEAGGWINKTFSKVNRVCYLHPFLAVVSDIDPFDNKKSTLLWSLDKDSLNLLPDSTLIVWDSHYAPQEGNLPLDLLKKDTNFIPLKYYKYYLDFPAFESWIFMKNKNHDTSTHDSIAPELITDFGPIDNLREIDSETFNFDSNKPVDTSLLTNEKCVSGEMSLKYTTEKEFGPMFSKKINEIKNFSSLRMIQINFKFFSSDSTKEIIPVIEIKNGNKTIFWHGEKINGKMNDNTWNACEIKRILFPNELNEDFILNFYFWNKGRRNFYVDDLQLKYLGLK
ncbi:MAG: hypothetical protein HY840_00335 [Bacteroidetes bacterium]|nr:hypothetical protein [Bacteroidota bacterium]